MNGMNDWKKFKLMQELYNYIRYPDLTSISQIFQKFLHFRKLTKKLEQKEKDKKKKPQKDGGWGSINLSISQIFHEPAFFRKNEIFSYNF